MAKELTLKQIRFCEEYLIDFNGTQAAIRAGYSKKTAQEIASENLSKPIISEFIKKRQAELSKNASVSAQDVLNELKKIGFSNVQDFIKEGFTIEEIQSLKKEHAAAIQSISIETTEFKGSTTTNVKFKLYDKISALEKIAKHIGFFEKDNTQQTKIIIEGG